MGSSIIGDLSLLPLRRLSCDVAGQGGDEGAQAGGLADLGVLPSLAAVRGEVSAQAAV